MKIGLITLPLHTNYGGVIQCYALQEILKKLGHTVIVLEDTPSITLKERILAFLKKTIYCRKLRSIDIGYNQNINRFIDQYIERLTYSSFTEIDKNDFNCFVVGSDQVWRPDFIRDAGTGLYDRYLFFAKSWNVKRIAYAASFGLDKWTYTEKETKLCKNLLKLFNGVSIREQSGVELCKTYLGCNSAVRVADPTLLLDKDDYLNLIKDDSIADNANQIFSYILDSSGESKEFELVVEEKSGLKVYSPFSEEDIQKNTPKAPIENWLSAFRNSELIITDSFHGCVFSIIFNKPFWVIKNDAGGNTRIETLLSIYNLESRFVTPQLLKQRNIYEAIDWDFINKIREDEKNKSINFLYSNLK